MSKLWIALSIVLLVCLENKIVSEYQKTKFCITNKFETCIYCQTTEAHVEDTNPTLNNMFTGWNVVDLIFTIHGFILKVVAMVAVLAIFHGFYFQNKHSIFFITRECDLRPDIRCRIAPIDLVRQK